MSGEAILGPKAIFFILGIKFLLCECGICVSLADNLLRIVNDFLTVLHVFQGRGKKNIYHLIRILITACLRNPWLCLPKNSDLWTKLFCSNKIFCLPKKKGYWRLVSGIVDPLITAAIHGLYVINNVWFTMTEIAGCTVRADGPFTTLR